MKADLHIHTKYSYDSMTPPKDAVESAIEKGIGCICVTDHGKIQGAIEAMKFGFDKNILVIPGIEILSASGDILGINVKKIIPDGLSAEETIKEIRKQGGIAVIPHPFGRLFSGFWGGEEKIKKANSDAIEIFNASIHFNSSNLKALDFSQKNNFSFTAGSDAHRKEFIGRGYIEFSGRILSERDIIDAIANKKGIVGGRSLTFFELLKNSLNADVRAMIKYCLLRKKSNKK